MVRLEDAQPNAIKAKNMVRDMRERLSLSFDYLITVAEEGLHTEFASARSALQILQSDLPINAVAYALHDELHFALNAQDVRKTKGLLESASSLRLTSSRLNFAGLGGGYFTEREESLICDTYHRRSAGMYSVEYLLTPPHPHYVSVSRDAFAYSLEQLKVIDQETYEETKEIVRDVLSVSTGNLNAASSFHTFGLVILSEFTPGQHWTRYLEHLVHEAAHYYLYSVLTYDPLVDAVEDAKFKSPFRAEPRPPIAIYHAMFVLARTLHVFNKMRDLPQYKEDYLKVRNSYNNAGNNMPFSEKFLMTYNVLSSEIPLTKVGQQLLASARELAQV